MDDRRWAIIDFDGTLIKGQSQRMLVQYLRRKGYISLWRYVRIMVWYVGFKLGWARNVKKIAEYAVGYLADKKVVDFDQVFDDFFETVCAPRMYNKAEDLVSLLREHSGRMIMVSTAIDPIVSRACAYFGIQEYLCTTLEVRDGSYTGRLSGEPVYAGNKKAAAEAHAAKNGIDLSKSIAIADHDSDIPLLSTVGYPVAVNPDRALHSHAQERGWPVIYLDSDEPLQHLEPHLVSERHSVQSDHLSFR